VAGSLQIGRRESGSLGSTCRWKALWVEQAAPFDEGAGEAVLGAPNEAQPTARPSAERDRERQRSFVNLARGRQRRGEVALRRRVVPSAPPPLAGEEESDREDRSWGNAPSSALHLGPGRRKAGWRRGRHRAPARRWRGRRGASHALGNRVIHGCSCRESVAEVGEEHLPHASEGSREANRASAR